MIIVRGVCRVCGHTEDEESPELAQAVIAWHAYEKHRDDWDKVVGTPRPQDPDPRTPGGRILIKGRRIQLRLGN
jgi:hypothetical protein